MRILIVKVGFASSTAAKYSSGAALQRCSRTPNAALTCSTLVGDTPARGSGRRGRRFKSCHPDHSRRSLTCGNALSCARFSTFQPLRQSLEGTKRNMREQKGKTGPSSTGGRTPASQHEAEDPAAQKGPSGHCDPPSTTKRPLGRNARQPGIAGDPKSASSSGSGQSPSAPSAEDPVDPCALNSTNRVRSDDTGRDVWASVWGLRHMGETFVAP